MAERALKVYEDSTLRRHADLVSVAAYLILSLCYRATHRYGNSVCLFVCPRCCQTVQHVTRLSPSSYDHIMLDF